MSKNRYVRLALLFIAAIAVLFLSLCRGADSPPTETPTAIPSKSVEVTPVATATAAIAQPPADNPIGLLFRNPDNPRYFTDGEKENGKYRVVYLSGSHFWDNLQDSGKTDQLPYLFNYSGWLDFLRARNHNFFRLWTWEQAKWVVESSTPYYFTPLPYERTGPGNALDGEPKFDLTKFNQAYFDRMRERIIEAGDHGMYVSVMLFDGWSVSYPKSNNSAANPWEAHPYNKANNINNINGDPNNDNSGDEINKLFIDEVTRLQDAYVRKVIDTVSDLDNVLYEIANESNGCGSEVNWQYHMIDFIKSYESSKEKQHPVGMTVPYPCGDNATLFDSNNHADWVSPNGDLNNPPVADGSKVIVADTDHLCGICGDRSWAWKSFTRGENLLFMDQYDDSYKLEGGGYDLNSDENLRYNLGYIRAYANRMNLVDMTPHGELCSTGYCLANPVAVGAEYLVFLPEGGTVAGVLNQFGIDKKVNIPLPLDDTVKVDLSASPIRLMVEWFNPQDDTIIDGGVVEGGATHSFTAPFSGDAVLYIFDVELAQSKPTSTQALP